MRKFIKEKGDGLRSLPLFPSPPLFGSVVPSHNYPAYGTLGTKMDFPLVLVLSFRGSGIDSFSHTCQGGTQKKLSFSPYAFLPPYVLSGFFLSSRTSSYAVKFLFFREPFSALLIRAPF